MISQQSFSTQDKIYALIGHHRLNDAFAMLNRVITDNDAFSLADELSAAETSYKYLIQYFIAGSEDPRRELIRAEIIESLYSITDRLVMHIEGKSSGAIFPHTAFLSHLIRQHHCHLSQAQKRP